MMILFRCVATATVVVARLPGLVCRLRSRYSTYRACHVDAGTAMEVPSEKTDGEPRPPAAVRGMTVLDRDAFRTVVKVPYFEVDAKRSSEALSAVRSYLLKLPSFRPVQETGEECRKTFILNPALVSGLESLSERARATLERCGVERLGEKEVPLHYYNWSAEAVLRAVLGQPDAAGYSVVGHVLHLNLRPHLDPYKRLIGQVYLDKLKNVSCVVNKVNIIENTFRNFRMEVLAGEANTLVAVRENGVKFEFDFAEVYWNPRLSTEHSRIVSRLGPDEVLYDVFAGVGPFAVPAARRKCTVFANDLNPHSFKWLNHNVALNKVAHLAKTYNLDGRDFLRSVFGEHAPRQLNEGRRVHVVMNLPSLAPRFLDALAGVVRESDLDPDVATRPFVHCYCFAQQGEGRGQQALSQVRAGIGGDVVDAEVKFVRTVAPNKDMMRITFRVPLDLLAVRTDPPSKKCRLEGNDDDVS